MAEFKKLSEVEQIETVSDNATVLVEEGGEIKRVPKTEVGGGGAGGYIATLTIDDLNSPAVDFNGVVLSENYDELYDVLCAGGSAWIDITAEIANAPASYAMASVSPTNYDKVRCSIIFWMITDIGLMGFISYMGERAPFLFPNGSHNLEYIGGDS